MRAAYHGLFTARRPPGRNEKPSQIDWTRSLTRLGRLARNGTLPLPLRRSQPRTGGPGLELGLGARAGIRPEWLWPGPVHRLFLPAALAASPHASFSGQDNCHEGARASIGGFTLHHSGSAHVARGLDRRGVLAPLLSSRCPRHLPSLCVPRDNET